MVCDGLAPTATPSARQHRQRILVRASLEPRSRAHRRAPAAGSEHRRAVRELQLLMPFLSSICQGSRKPIKDGHEQLFTPPRARPGTRARTRTRGMPPNLRPSTRPPMPTCATAHPAHTQCTGRTRSSRSTTRSPTPTRQLARLITRPTSTARRHCKTHSAHALYSEDAFEWCHDTRRRQHLNL